MLYVIVYDFGVVTFDCSIFVGLLVLQVLILSVDMSHESIVNIVFTLFAQTAFKFNIRLS